VETRSCPHATHALVYARGGHPRGQGAGGNPQLPRCVLTRGGVPRGGTLVESRSCLLRVCVHTARGGVPRGQNAGGNPRRLWSAHDTRGGFPRGQDTSGNRSYSAFRVNALAVLMFASALARVSVTYSWYKSRVACIHSMSCRVRMTRRQ
jgi:hypothetical protein